MHTATPATLTDQEFGQFQRFIYEAAGITLSASKKALVCGRLAKRLLRYSFGSYADYMGLLASGKAQEEIQVAIDLLTTNETYFFREARHFDFLRQHAREARASGGTYRVWSAASSSGEEAYSAAMVLDDALGASGWEVFGSDISTRVLAQAAAACYPIDHSRRIPPNFRSRYCLRGFGTEEGKLLITRQLRSRVRFAQVRLNAPLPVIGSFDVIFLRNVMIYFNGDTKREVVRRVVSALKPGGYLLVGHAESLNDLAEGLHLVAPSTYRKAT
jgi:chemotaxis protein methyltransferase CheR